GILSSDSPETAAAKLRPLAGDDPWVEAHLRPLVGLGGLERLDGDRRAEAFSAWTRFATSLAARAPLVLAFEDLHWADEGLLDFVEHLAGHREDVPLTLVCTARPELLERRPGWQGLVEIEPL